MGDEGVVYSFAKINFDPRTQLTNKELQIRADSLAFSKYKFEIRERAKYNAKRKFLWFMAIVKCKVFVTRLKKKWLESKENARVEREERELEARQRLDSSVNYNSNMGNNLRSKLRKNLNTSVAMMQK